MSKSSKNNHYKVNNLCQLRIFTTTNCRGIKRYIFNTYLSHINYQSGRDFLFQECTQSEATIYPRLMPCNMYYSVSNEKLNGCLKNKSNYNNINSNALKS